MAEIQANSSLPGGKRRAKRLSTRVDMTPMVDLAFLLLTFFVLTATFSKPRSMELTFPVPNGDPAPLKNGITFLLSKDNRIFYYEGEFRAEETASGPKTQLLELSFAQNGKQSLHNYLLLKNKSLQDQIRVLEKQLSGRQLHDSAFKRLVREKKADKSAFTYLIKTDDKATYENVIDLIDELNINVVGKYVMVDMMKPELDLVNELIAMK